MIVQYIYIYNILINEYKETNKLRDEAEHSSESQQLTQPFVSLDASHYHRYPFSKFPQSKLFPIPNPKRTQFS